MKTIFLYVANIVMIVILGVVGFMIYTELKEKDSGVISTNASPVNQNEKNISASESKNVKKGWVELDYFAGSESSETKEFLVPEEVSKLKLTYNLTASKSTDMFFIDVVDFRSKDVLINGDEFNGLGVFLKKSSESHQVILEDLVSGDYYNLDIKAFVDSWEVIVEVLYE